MILSVMTMILLPASLVLLMLLFITLNRFIRYKERVALAQLGYSSKDLALADNGTGRGSRGVLWGGVITATSGLALLLGLSTLGIGVWLIAGFLPLFVGLGMILIYFLTPAPSSASGEVPADPALDSEHMPSLGAPEAQDEGPWDEDATSCERAFSGTSSQGSNG
jgi:hypothetical protein